MQQLSDRKILVTGPAGQIARPLTEALAADNEVWGVARFSDAEARAELEALGVTTRVVDLDRGPSADLPDDFTHVLHLAVRQGPGDDTDAAVRTNAEGTGLLMAHCRRAEAVLVMSTFSVYDPSPDRDHAYREDDPLGDTRQPYAPTYSVSKIAQEAVARTMARVLGLPTVIARMNASYGPNGGLPAIHLAALRAGTPIVLRDPGPSPYSPIHERDIIAQTPALLAAASVPATIVNWAGDDAVTAEQWVAELERLTGLTAEVQRVRSRSELLGSVSDNTRRLELAGPCSVRWRAGVAELVAQTDR